MSKKVLLLQLRPEDELADGELQALIDAGLDAHAVERIRMEQGALPNIVVTDYKAIILGGGPSCASYPSEKKFDYQLVFEPWLFAILRAVVSYDVPFLGMCYAIGAMNVALGVQVSGTYAERVGAVPIRLTTQSHEEPVLQGIPETFEAFVGHKEAADELPPEATLLARSDTCPVQLYRLGKRVFVSQFHPELDYDQLEKRVLAYKHLGYFKPEEVADILQNARKHDTSHARQMLVNFISTYCK